MRTPRPGTGAAVGTVGRGSGHRSCSRRVARSRRGRSRQRPYPPADIPTDIPTAAAREKAASGGAIAKRVCGQAPGQRSQSLWSSFLSRRCHAMFARRVQRLLGGGGSRGSAPRPDMAEAEYENMELKQHVSPAAAPGSAAAPGRRALGAALALGTVLALGASLAAVGALYARAERELRAARAAAAAGASALPSCAPDAAHGRWLQQLSLGWRYHDGKIYYFSTDRKSWQDAEDFCVSKRSHLASITSAEEQEYLAGQVGSRGHWIGLTDAGTEGTWRWVGGTEYSQNMSFWAPGQPDNWQEASGGREDCAHLQPEDSNLWNDGSCAQSLHWICEAALEEAGP
ncbi:C-type lectin domain family 4 member F-like isoform X2 [Dromaius novaehollandiae]|uniref:C-type lectin domain family 4 member F-like isoform X2 n=1 Tax=Dromaius novaehollandiae TaxID=8790 RepID=UPI00311D8779